jgi:hypothetical protein
LLDYSSPYEEDVVKGMVLMCEHQLSVFRYRCLFIPTFVSFRSAMDNVLT